MKKKRKKKILGQLNGQPPSFLHTKPSQARGGPSSGNQVEAVIGYRDNDKTRKAGRLRPSNASESFGRRANLNDNNGPSPNRRYNNSQPDQPTNCYDPDAFDNEDINGNHIRSKPRHPDHHQRLRFDLPIFSQTPCAADGSP